MSNHPQTEVILAAATGSAGGLGKIAAIPATTGKLLVRLDNLGFGRAAKIDWRVKTDQACTVQPLRASGVVNAATVTLASMADTETGPIINGLTYTAEDTATDAAAASRKYYTGGADDTADAVKLAALINADYAVATAGTSVADTDKLTFTTSEGTHVIVAAAAADYTTGQYALSAVVATELASIVLAINHKVNVTLATCTAGNTVTMNVPGVGVYTYTAHASATTVASREFSISGNDTADAAALVLCINNDTAASGITASNVAGVVSLARGSASVPTPILTSSSDTLAACVNTAGGVPGVIAVASGATGELTITPTWVSSLTVDESGDQLTVTDIDVPGIYAVPAAAIVTLSCTTPGSPAGGEKATAIQAVTGTGAGHCAIADTTLASCALDGAVTTIAATNAAYSGQLIRQTIEGWAAGYLLISNTTGAAQTVTVAATRY